MTDPNQNATMIYPGFLDSNQHAKTHYNMNSLIGFPLKTTDGVLGRVCDFYLDEQGRIVRYLLIKTSPWIYARRVLLPTAFVLNERWRRGSFPVTLTTEQIRSCPRISINDGIRTQQQIPFRPNLSQVHQAPVLQRSVRRLCGFTLYAIDGQIGQITDLIINRQTWMLEFLVVQTNKGFSRQKGLIKMRSIREIQWTKKLVFLNLTLALIDDMMDYDAGQFDAGIRRVKQYNRHHTELN